ncbi:hypothetical protein K8354_16805 [Polaribacter litorisediminis]|uniref:hypothetical protein n=1 Tax=Polaribacter litorisediminis TaxID=1908341 RepID=UPI001CBEDD1E|nr:hypothetical protein [Polaribacter litorisediminis]UAM97925.1 hypothetical protein K8354_16805 [Polaribacter litorisediminis]
MKKFYLLLLLFCVFNFSASGQSKEKKIDSLFSARNNVYQEVVYAHLNKSIYVKGEMLAFTAYVFDKNTKKLSNETNNLYCTITDEHKNIVESKLFKVEKGIVDGYFMITDSIKSGSYTFTSYTNWMRNFSQKNFFSDKFKVIDSESIYYSKKVVKDFSIDAQFLPESGHLLDGVVNTVGVVIKDTLGLGVANLKGRILDDKDNFITSFQVNQNGIGRFSFIPNYLNTYKAEINNRNKLITVNITEPIQKKGVLLKVSRNKENALISVKTNNSSKLNKRYSLTFHNGKELNTIDIDFKNKSVLTTKIPFKNLPRGITVFTLFNEQENPIAERLFFNYHKLNIIKSTNTFLKKEEDSVNATLQFTQKNIGFNNVSVSVLPKTTNSYKKNTNIISQVLVQPFVKGVIENADYYFKDFNERKIQELDNLLITQGWSSYDWKDMFIENDTLKYKFERGISIKVNISKVKKKSKYFIHSLSNKPPLMIEFDEEVKSFSHTDYFPMDDEKLYISKVRRKGNLAQPNIHIEFNINKIPSIKNLYGEVAIAPNYFSSENFVDFSNFEKLNKTDVLDEVVIKVNLDKKRKDSVRGRTFGRVFFLNDLDRNQTLANFLDFRPAFRAYDDWKTGYLVVYNKRKDNSAPAIFLDGFQVFTFDMLYGYFLDTVDYIDIDTESMWGNGGVIKIVTDPKRFTNNRPTVKEVKFPVSFTKPKKFYIPKYENYKNAIYKKFGVIDWLPINKIDENGQLSLDIRTNQHDDITLYIEGITKNGDFILEEKTITLKE